MVTNPMSMRNATDSFLDSLNTDQIVYTRMSLDMGVDGVMTDYPEKVGAFLRKWNRVVG